MPKFEKWFHAIDEPHELGFLLVFIVSVLLLWFEKVGELTFSILVVVSVVTLLGVKYYRGLSIGPKGLSVGGGNENVNVNVEAEPSTEPNGEERSSESD